MIYGIGTDIIEINRIKDGHEKFGDSYLNKIYTAQEIEYCLKYKNKYERLAGRFASKEAFMKAIGCGISQGVWFKDIEILSRPTGQPYIQLNSKLIEKFSFTDKHKFHVTISHCRSYAVSTVVIEELN